MLDTQRALAERFASLSPSRIGPIFFIEHGLDDPEVSQLRAAVREAAQLQPPESHWWRERPLPLLVVATEIGYRYRGAGTDFWPLLEDDLGIELTPDSRQHIRDLFDACASEYRGARPPDTPWANAFRLIAWPITHALVPIEFHRALAAALANLRTSALALDTPNLHRAIQTAAGHTSVRFATLLDNQGLVASVVRALLGGGDGELSDGAICRITKDLKSDNAAGRDIRLAERTQRRIAAQGGGSGGALPAPHGLQTVVGHFQLRRRDNTLTLEAVFPRATGVVTQDLRRVLRRRRFAPKLWGVSSRVPSEQLLSGLPFTVKLTAVPDVDAPLFPGLANLGIDTNLLQLLESFQLVLRPRLLFGVSADGEVAREVRAREVSGHRIYWLLVEDGTDGFADLPNLGEIGPYRCFELNPSHARASGVLAHYGYRVHFGMSVLFTGAPPLDNNATVPQFLVGDERIIVQRRENPVQLEIELDPEQCRIEGDRLVRVGIPEGEHILRITSDGRSRSYPFQGVKQAVDPEMPACWIELSAPELTVQALLAGSIALKIDGLAPLEGLELTIELEASGHRMGVTWLLGPLPQNLFGDKEPWSTLLDLDDSTRERVLQDPSPILHVRVGAIASESWPLEQRLRPCWWVRHESGITLQSEMGVLGYGGVDVAMPTAPPTPVPPDDELVEARLLSPLEIDTATFEPTAMFTSLCIAPDQLPLGAPAMYKPRLQRRRRAEGAPVVGAEDLTEAYLRWMLAESASITAELRRRQVAAQLDIWLAELGCGANWADREMRVNTSFADPWTLLFEECHETGFGRDPMVSLPPEDEAVVTRLAVGEIRHARPELWAQVGVPDAVDDGDYDALDWACIRAYGQLSERYRDAGRRDLADEAANGDVGNSPEQWNSVLGRVKARWELRELAELLLPTDSAPRLMAPDLTLAPLGEIKDELRRWAQESSHALQGRAVPDEAVLEAILALWVAPETAVTLDWRGAMNTLLAERSVARAARYLALRARSARRMNNS